VVRLMDWHDDEVLSIVMELVRGETLRKKMRQGGLPLDEALPILKGIAQGVAHAHERGTVHNDLKPDNVMVTPDGRVRVMDFGIATAQAHTRLTATGETMGTPGYMAPEQYDGIRTDPRSDQYAFGVLAWEMLTGSRLFDEPDAMRRMARHMTETPPRVSDVVPGVPDVVSDVIARMLAKEAKDRYPTMQEAFRALEVAAVWSRGR
jgi:serine/threonine protein kinase